MEGIRNRTRVNIRTRHSESVLDAFLPVSLFDGTHIRFSSNLTMMLEIQLRATDSTACVLRLASATDQDVTIKHRKRLR